MPELPEVETVMRGLKPVFEGRRLVRVEQRREGLRFPFPPDFKERLAGKRITSLRRRAKYILASIEGGDCLLIHLGMTGRFTVLHNESVQNLSGFHLKAPAGDGGTGAHDHVVFTFDNGTRVVFTDPRRFGVMDIFTETESHKLLKTIGVEPLGNEFHAGYLAAKFAGKSAPLKAVLLDQRIVAGLGNIYVCEALNRAGLSPKRRAGTLARRGRPDQRLEALVRHIREVLLEAIGAGGSTLRDFAHADGAAGAFQQRFLVYGREGEPCGKCGAPIRRIVQAGRSSFYCKACQR